MCLLGNDQLSSQQTEIYTNTRLIRKNIIYGSYYLFYGEFNEAGSGKTLSLWILGLMNNR